MKSGWRRQKRGGQERQTEGVRYRCGRRMSAGCNEARECGEKKGSMRVRLRGLVKDLLKRKRRGKGAL